VVLAGVFVAGFIFPNFAAGTDVTSVFLAGSGLFAGTVEALASHLSMSPPRPIILDLSVLK
jgi:hypothetical protein